MFVLSLSCLTPTSFYLNNTSTSYFLGFFARRISISISTVRQIILGRVRLSHTIIFEKPSSYSSSTIINMLRTQVKRSSTYNILPLFHKKTCIWSTIFFFLVLVPIPRRISRSLYTLSFGQTDQLEVKKAKLALINKFVHKLSLNKLLQ